jgi:hypothetical protein
MLSRAKVSSTPVPRNAMVTPSSFLSNGCPSVRSYLGKCRDRTAVDVIQARHKGSTGLCREGPNAVKSGAVSEMRIYLKVSQLQYETKHEEPIARRCHSVTRSNLAWLMGSQGITPLLATPQIPLQTGRST